jgi:cytochrome c oxidase cbb3-type subunit III
MHAHARLIAAVVIAGAATMGLGLAQQGTPPGQPPATGRGAGPGQRGADPGGRGQAAGGRRGGFTQFTRALAPPDVLVRGKSLYEAHCASCHATDLRGGAKGTNLLRSGIALRDQHGELVGESVAKHSPALTLANDDVVAIAEFLHSVHATMGGQGSPPGRNPTDVELNVLVGDREVGERYFRVTCSSCHSVTGDLKGIGSKYPDARALQNAWVGGTSGRFGGGGRGGAAGAGNPAVVTLEDGSKVEGTLVRQDDWLVILRLPDGSRKSMARTTGMKVDVMDRTAAHKKMVLDLDDPTNKKMHDVTAYLWTVK